MDPLFQMKVFAKVAEKQSFVGAARSLNLSTAAVSKHVGALEERLATRLLNRTTRRVSVTDTGRAYYERCLTILADVEETESEIRQTGGAARGVLRLGAPMSLGILYLGKLLGDFLARYPEISVDIQLNDRLVDPIEEGLDLTLRIATVLPVSALIATRIGPMGRVLCAAPSYFKSRPQPKHPRDLKDHNCIVFSILEDWDFHRKGETLSIKAKGSLISNNSIVIREAIVGGLGVGLMPKYIVAEALKSGALLPLLDGYQIESYTLFAVYPHHRYLSRKVRVFLDYLKEYFPGVP